MRGRCGWTSPSRTRSQGPDGQRIELHDAPGGLRFLVEDAGARYLLTVDPTFTQQAYLKASNTGVLDQFGSSMAVDGNTVLVGAFQEDSSTTGINTTPNESASNAGAAYENLLGSYARVTNSPRKEVDKYAPKLLTDYV